MERVGWVITSYAVCVTAAVLFAVYAIVYGKLTCDCYASIGPDLDEAMLKTHEYRSLLQAAHMHMVSKGVMASPAAGFLHQRRQAKLADTEEFVTARGTQHIGRIAWSFYAGAVGAWAIATPGSYAGFAGIVGVVVYALACGFPILMIAFFGNKITAAMPHVYSMSDFMGWRYGPIAKTISVLLCMFNLSIFLLAEFTTIGSLFKDFVGSISWGIIIVVGVLTLAYTAYGGLLVSLVTDQIQGIASMLLMIILAIFVAVTYR
jgi:Na+/proline symporter